MKQMQLYIWKQCSTYNAGKKYITYMRLVESYLTLLTTTINLFINPLSMLLLELYCVLLSI